MGPPLKILNLRGGSVSPGSRAYDTSVIKVNGEVFDRDGYRMDVTVWFRHRNEVLYYLDSGGTVHGPMDQKHSTRLGNVSRSGQFVPGSRHYLSESETRYGGMRRQSESEAWDLKSEMRTHAAETYRGRTYSESRRPYQHHYKTMASHHLPGTGATTSQRISRWSSMQGPGVHGLWRPSGQNRYATTLTRQHIKRYHDPVEMVFKQSPSIGASKVDLVSIDNRDSSPQLHYYETESRTERERRLQEELMNTRRELNDLKRTRSLTGDHHLLSPMSAKRTVKSTSNQYLNDHSWTTHTLKKNEGQPCGAPVASHPKRAMSQTNIHERTQMPRNFYVSDTNIEKITTVTNQPAPSTYSAHRENMRQREEEEQRRAAEETLLSQRSSSLRQNVDSRNVMGGELLQNIETITLQPIGRGVYDLEPPGSSVRSLGGGLTPTGSLYGEQLLNRPQSSAARLLPTSPSIMRNSRRNSTRSDDPHFFQTLPSKSATQRPPWVSMDIKPLRDNRSSIYSDYTVRSVYGIPPSGPTRRPANVNSNTIARKNLSISIEQANHTRPSLPLSQPIPVTRTTGADQSDVYRTIATTNMRDVYSSGPQSPYVGPTADNLAYESINPGSNTRYEAEQHWKTNSTVNRATNLAPLSPLDSSFGGSGGPVDTLDSDTGLKRVKDTYFQWYLPNASRAKMIELLRDKPTGSFYIRNSVSHADCFSIGVKIPQNSIHIPPRQDDLGTGFVRSYLIGLYRKNGMGYSLCGFHGEPHFANLVAFVHHYLQHPGPWACTLRLPTNTTRPPLSGSQQQMTFSTANRYMSPMKPGLEVDVLYLGSVEVGQLEGDAAVRRAISQLFNSTITSGGELFPKRCEVLLKVIPREGIRFSDVTKRTSLRKTIKPNQFIWCGLDPESRDVNNSELNQRGVYNAKIFGIVSRKQRVFFRETIVYVFCELDLNQSATSLVQHIQTLFRSP